MQTGVKKDGSVEHEAVPDGQPTNRSHHHVEQVIARILAKRHTSAKQRSAGDGDLEDKGTDAGKR